MSDSAAFDAYCRASRIPPEPPQAEPGSFAAKLRARAARTQERLPKPRLRPDRRDEPPAEVYADPSLVGLWYATAAQSGAKEALATTLYDALTDMAMGHGLSLGAMAQDDDGRLVIAVTGAIDLVALARRALAFRNRRHMEDATE